MSIDYKDILSQVKEKLIEENGGYFEEEFDTIGKIDDINRSCTSHYNENNKRLFKCKISENNSKKIMDIVLDTSNKDLNSYKRGVYKVCLNIYNAYGENPIEFLLFSSQGLYGKDEYKRMIVSVIREIYEENNEIVEEAFNNILKCWTFEEPLKMILNSISSLRISLESEGLYRIFENNLRLREEAAYALINLKAEDIYRDMLNLICAQRNISSEEIEVSKRIINKFASSSNENAFKLYKFYINYEASIERSIRFSIVYNVKNNFNTIIYEDMERRVLNSQTNNRVFDKVVEILDRSKENKECIRILNLINRGTEVGTESELLERLKSNKISSRQKSNIVINLAKSNNREVEEYLKKLLDVESEEKIAALSVMVQKGDVIKIVELFGYLVSKDNNEVLSNSAFHQVRRLISLRDQKINSNLYKVAEKILNIEEEKHINKTLKIIDLFKNNATSDEIGSIFLKKLINTQHAIIKIELLGYFQREYNKFNKQIQEKLKECVIENTSKTESDQVQLYAKECLKMMNKNSISTPELI